MSQAAQPNQVKGFRLPSFNTMMLLGVLVGIGWGVFWGEDGAWIGWCGSAYVGLLQMTVLPFVVVSLVVNIGRLSASESGRLARVCTTVMGLLWLVALCLLVAMQFCFPSWEGGSFFSVSMFKEPEPVDWLGLFIPSNIFVSLTRDFVPAVVLFSVGFGVALMAVPKRDVLIANLEVVADGLGRLNRMVVRLAPVGMFAIVAEAAGTFSPIQFQLLQGYLLVYCVATLLLSLWIFPLLISCVTPFSYRATMRECREPLITAFVIGNTFVVMPMIADAVNRLVSQVPKEKDPSQQPAGYTVQLAYPFPDAGRIIGLIFIPFAAWFYGIKLSASDSLPLIGTGLLSSFAKPIVTTPMLLDMAEIPMDIFNLYLAVGVVAARFGDLAKAMNLCAFSVLTAAYLAGILRIRYRRLIVVSLASICLIFISIAGIRIILKQSFQEHFSRDDLTLTRTLQGTPVESTILTRSDPNPEPLQEGEDPMDRILRRGVLRVGINPEKLPFCYYNGVQQLVGFDVDMAHQLARDLGVRIEFVPMSDSTIVGLRTDQFDVAMSQSEGTVQRSIELPKTEPYLEVTQSIIAPDYLRREFGSIESLGEYSRDAPTIRVAFVAGSISSENTRDQLSAIELGTGAAAIARAGLSSELEFVEVTSEREFFESSPPIADALVTSAEVGSAWTLRYPKYSVVRPKGVESRVPLYYHVASQSRFQDFMDGWLRLKKSDGTVNQLFDYWILGIDSTPSKPRWCIARDVLQWVE